MLDECLKYAARGKPVFPCRPDKRPLTEHGFKDATTDDATITEWWTRWPGALIGMPTGLATRIIVLDVDVKNGHDGEGSLFQLQEQNQRLPETIEVLTPSGGRHLHFAHPGTHIPCSAGKLGDGLDVRGDGGYIILPPSRIGDRRYEYEASNLESPAQIPAWLADLVVVNSKIRESAYTPPGVTPAGVPVGMRNSELFRYACSLRARGLGEQEAATLLRDFAARSIPPLPEREVAAVLRSAWRYHPSHPLNDLGNARRLVDLAGEDLRYLPETGRWLIWDDHQWREDGDGQATRFAKNVYELIRAEVQNTPDPDMRKALERHAKVSGQVGRVDAMLNLAATEPGVPVVVDQLDADPLVIGVPGGVVDLRTGEMRGGRREDLITKRVAVAPVDEEADAERWHRFLEEVTRGDDDLIRFLRQLTGYCLTGDTSEHVLVFVYGPGGNGKSVFLNTLVGVMNEYAETAAMDTFTASRGDRHPTDLAMLRGSRLVTASETEEGRAWAESRIKQLTGGDRISARFMRQDFFTFQPRFKLLIVGNHRPVLNNVDEATRRRFRLVPFLHRPDRPDRALETRLRAEWSAILRWAINGCRDWLNHGLSQPNSVIEATAGYFEEQDLFGAWLQDLCDVAPDQMDTHAKLFRSWSRFADDNGEKSGSAKRFTQEMSRRGFISCKNVGGMRGRGFRGIRVSPEQAQPQFQDVA